MFSYFNCCIARAILSQPHRVCHSITAVFPGAVSCPSALASLRGVLFASKPNPAVLPECLHALISLSTVLMIGFAFLFRLAYFITGPMLVILNRDDASPGWGAQRSSVQGPQGWRACCRWITGSRDSADPYYCAPHMSHVLHTEGCGNPALSESISVIFQQQPLTSCLCTTFLTFS